MASKPFIYFKCQSRKTVITYGETAGKAGGTTASASTSVHSSNFIASDCTFVVSGGRDMRFGERQDVCHVDHDVNIGGRI